ncbi:MAG: hypothetical protein IIU98_04685, partial [Ruminococcus sp.]|nr:hypothetical protein [Ruminococcus sp.]
YDLYEEREKRGIDDIYLMRIEQLYPVPLKALVHLQRGENRIAAVEPHTLLVPLMKACQRGRTQAETIALTNLQSHLLCSVKTYTMTCQPDMAAAEMAYNTIIKGRTE